MQYKPARNNKNAYVMCSILAVCAAICAVAEGTGMGRSLINEFLLVVFITAVLYVFIRHVLADYVYHVTDNGCLDIVKITANVPKTLASVKISAGDMIVKAEKDMRKKHPEIAKIERYDLTLFSVNNYWYIFDQGGVKYALILECDEGFVKYLRDRIDKAGG